MQHPTQLNLTALMHQRGNIIWTHERPSFFFIKFSLNDVSPSKGIADSGAWELENLLMEVGQSKD